MTGVLDRFRINHGLILQLPVFLHERGQRCPLFSTPFIIFTDDIHKGLPHLQSQPSQENTAILRGIKTIKPKTGVEVAKALIDDSLVCIPVQHVIIQTFISLRRGNIDRLAFTGHLAVINSR